MPRLRAQFAFTLFLAFATTMSLASAPQRGGGGGNHGGGGMGGNHGGGGIGPAGPSGGNPGGSGADDHNGHNDHNDHGGHDNTGHGFPVLTGHHSSLGMGLPTHGMHSMGLAGRWWDDSRTSKSIGLTSDQQKRMDGIFESSKPAILERFNALQQQQQNLNRLSKKDLDDEGKVNTAIDQVTQARADLEKTTSQVFSQIRSELTDSQRARLDDAIAKQQ